MRGRCSLIVRLELSQRLDRDSRPSELFLEVVGVAEAAEVVGADIHEESARTLVEEASDDPFLGVLRVPFGTVVRPEPCGFGVDPQVAGGKPDADPHEREQQEDLNEVETTSVQPSRHIVVVRDRRTTRLVTPFLS